jgi:hypothetical protein
MESKIHTRPDRRHERGALLGPPKDVGSGHVSRGVGSSPRLTPFNSLKRDPHADDQGCFSTSACGINLPGPDAMLPCMRAYVGSNGPGSLRDWLGGLARGHMAEFPHRGFCPRRSGLLAPKL